MNTIFIGKPLGCLLILHLILRRLCNDKCILSIEKENATAKAEYSVKVLNGQPIGKILECVSEEMVSDALQEYIHDFVHTMYHAVTEPELQVNPFSKYLFNLFYVSNSKSMC